MAGHLAPGGAYKYFARGKTLTRVKSWRKGEFTSPAQVKSMGSPPGTAGWGVPPAQGVDQGHGAKVLLGGGIDKAKVFRHIDRSVMRDGGQGCYPCDLMGPSRALRPRQFSPDGDLLFARAKRRQKHAGGQARMNFKRKGRAFVHSACTPGPPFLRGPILVMRHSLSGVAVSRRSLLPVSARRSIGSRRTLPGPRVTPGHRIDLARRSTVGR